MSKCKGCGREIAWGRTPDGALTPLDIGRPIYRAVTVEETDRGPVFILERAPAHYLSHFVTCPDRDSFRKAKRPWGTHSGEARKENP